MDTVIGTFTCEFVLLAACQRRSAAYVFAQIEVEKRGQMGHLLR